MSVATVYRSEAGRRAIHARYDAALANWPVPYEPLTIDTRYGSTFVIACGSPANEPVVLLHGSMFNSAMWMPDATRLSNRYRVYAVDVIGEPGKSAESRPTMRTAGNYARWLGEVLDGLHAPAAAVVGNSLGGWIALDFATAHPDRVSRLVLLAPAGLATARGSFMLKAMVSMLLGKRGLLWLNRIVMGGASVPPEVLDFMTLVARQFNARKEPLYVFNDAELRRLTMPVLYVGGDKDALLRTEESVKRVESLLPNGRAVVLPGAHHALVDQCDRYMAFLED